MFICFYVLFNDMTGFILIFKRYANDYLMENFWFEPHKQVWLGITEKITILSSSEISFELLNNNAH